MSTTTLTPLEEALRLTRLGYYVVPNHESTDGVCTCVKGADCPTPAKHPRTRHGKDDGTRDEDQIRAWWNMWPNAAPYICLELSGLVLVSPDSEAWLKTMRGWRLPNTTKYQSREDEPWHVGYLYRRPDDCPIYQMNRPGEYDIMTQGGAVAPPAIHPKTGDMRRWINEPLPVDQLPECPQQAIAMLKNAAEKKTTAATSLSNDDDEPPVYLEGRALERWHGERYVTREDTGKIDRSGTLFALACDLVKATMTNNGIAAALADRDQSFNFPAGPKYANRPQMYLTTAANARAHVNAEPAPMRWKSETDDGPCNERVAELEAENERLRAEVERLKVRISKFFQVIRNPNVKGEKLTGLAVVNEIASAASREADRDGWVPISRAAIADKCGASEATVSTHIGRLDEWGAGIERRVVRKPTPGYVDQETGEIIDDPDRPMFISELQVRLRGTPEQALDRLATIEPTKDRKWGGKRVACPDHPNAALKKTTTLTCTECGQIVDQTEEYQSPEGLPVDENGEPLKHRTPLKSQVLISDHVAPSGEERTKGANSLISEDGPLFEPPKTAPESRNRILRFQAGEHDVCQIPGCNSRLYSRESRRFGYCTTHRNEALTGYAAAGSAE